MNPQKHNMAVLGQIVKLIPRKIIESLRKKHKIQTRSFTATSHVVAMIYSQLTHALSLNDVCDGMKNHHGILSQIRDCVPPSRNGLAHANKNRPAAMAEELFWIVYNELKTHDPEFFQSSRNYPGLPRRFKRAIHIVDSSTIPLIAKCMDWAKHRSQKAAAKLHMDLLLGRFCRDLRWSIGQKILIPRWHGRFVPISKPVKSWYLIRRTVILSIWQH